MRSLSSVVVVVLVSLLGPNETFANIGFELGSMVKNGMVGIKNALKTKAEKMNNVKFYLHSNTPDLEDKDYIHELVYKDANSVSGAPFNKNCVSKFMIHGYTQNKDASFPKDVKTAYLTRMRNSIKETERCWNIVAVDWGALAGGMYFLQAVGNVPIAGERVGEMLTWLLSLGFIADAKLIHLIGHSLGAHVSGYASASFVKLAKKRPGRISGSDPAGPSFISDANSGLGRILKTTDADFVDVYHCNLGAYGTNKAIGHAEFYPNAEPLSNIMPQCNVLKGAKLRLTTEDPDMCSHNMCPKYLAWAVLHPTLFEKCESIEKFVEKKGNCTGEMVTYGEDLDLTKSGSFYGNILENLENMESFM